MVFKTLRLRRPDSKPNELPNLHTVIFWVDAERALA